MLGPPPAREHELARQLLAGEAAGEDDSAALARAAERVLDHLRVQLSRWFGPDGFQAIQSRALDRARSRYPALTPVRIEDHGEHRMHGLVESTSTLSPAEGTEALTELITAMIGLLSRLVGDDMAARLVDQSWSDAARDEPRTNKERMAE